MRIVVAGTWDYLHEGHRELLEYARRLSCNGKIFVLVNGDDLIANRKKPKHNQYERALAVEMYCWDDGNPWSFVQIANNMEELKKAIPSPCFLLHGRDHSKESLSELYEVTPDWWDKNNIYLIYKDRYDGVSSTLLREQDAKTQHPGV